MITVIDCGIGNIATLANAYKRMNVEVAIARTAADLDRATRVILPGVGAFDHAIGQLDRSGMRDTLDELVLGKRVPVLGVCLGMQILARSSAEGQRLGLGWIDAHVRDFRTLIPSAGLPLPHMGWNEVHVTVGNGLFHEPGPGGRFYFLHSFVVECDKREDVVAFSHYGADFSCAVNSGNIYGVQFHPEKSHSSGMQLLKKFAEL